MVLAKCFIYPFTIATNRKKCGPFDTEPENRENHNELLMSSISSGSLNLICRLNRLLGRFIEKEGDKVSIYIKAFECSADSRPARTRLSLVRTILLSSHFDFTSVHSKKRKKKKKKKRKYKRTEKCNEYLK